MKKLLLYLLLLTSFNFTAQTNNYSIFFDGNNSGVDFGNSTDFDLENTTTICFWAKDSSNRNIRRSFLYKGNCSSSYCTDLLIWANDSSNPFINWTTGDGGLDVCNAGPIVLNIDSSWHFYSFVFIPITINNGVKKVYFDGVLIDSCQYNDNATPNSYNLLAGDYNGTNSNPIAAVDFMDDISIWSTALSQTELQQYMSCPPSGNESNLVSFWNFEEGTGTTTADQTSNGNNGTLINGALWSTVVPAYNCCTPNPITTQPTDQTVNIGNDATFSFNDTLTGATYQWQMDAGTGYSNLSNAGQFSGADTKTLTIASTTMSNNNTLYRCIVTESTSCMDTTNVSNLTVIDNTSIGELNNSLVKLFPNPSNGIITLTLAHHSNGQIILTDILGKEVLSKSFTSNEVQLNLKSLESKGTYFAKVLDSDGNVIAIKKLIYQ